MKQYTKPSVREGYWLTLETCTISDDDYNLTDYEIRVQVVDDTYQDHYAIYINGKRQLCAVVELSLKQKDLFDKIVKASGAKLQPDQEVALFEQFKAGQARERMDSAIKSGQN